MADETTSISLLRTKLQRPPIAGDHVHRLQLLERLDQRRQRPLTLVTAPAGYGKSTLVSCWLESCNLPAAWLSLDETDNDLHLFLSYFLAAVQTISPVAGQEIQTILNAPQLPSLSTLAGILINKLDQIEQAFILTLDDYHVIHNKAIHDLLIGILKHPPQAMHLVLVSRVDPPLPLTSLRAKGEMTEIRGQDLRFSLEETAEYLQKMMGKTIEDSIVTLLGKKTEGWVTGLRLAALSLRHREDLDRVLTDLPNDNRYVMDYMVAEVLSQQSSTMQTSIENLHPESLFCPTLSGGLSSGNRERCG
jgi:LuxR family maltose regulon positive regulatory protein